MKMNIQRPYGDTRLVKYLERRISDLRSTKTQTAIATEAGFRTPNMLAMIKNGSAKLPLDRVPGLAKALDCDAAMLFRMAVEQLAEDTTSLAIDQIFGAIITDNESAWLATIREASNNTDPSITAKAQKAIRAIFGR
ncbi:XRE family transcriptional regulator [Allomesorhizobium camelthorni]|uniref:XRE family transcriptional regulator n=1 Tax=Allomesorhizobium camelthorni TaxID=475069 RepID=A0A6G4WKZ0_9HYPH|nr:XRE family transcriptional regulator [Mesorhizobium camelthorni]NGO55482.1 XRE family transcriptional regulator [Mesorhizobium camelthorni]